MVFFLHASLFDGKNFPAGIVFKEYPFAFIFKIPAWAGCWIFFVLSGYLAAKGFVSNHYNLGLRGILYWYKMKIKKIYIPTLIFIVGVSILSYPEFLIKNNIELLYYFLSCTYYGAPGVDGIGVTWFVFTLM